MRNPNGFITHDFLDGVDGYNSHRSAGRKLRVNSPYPGCELVAWFAVVFGIAHLVARVFA